MVGHPLNYLSGSVLRNMIPSANIIVKSYTTSDVFFYILMVDYFKTKSGFALETKPIIVD